MARKNIKIEPKTPEQIKEFNLANNIADDVEISVRNLNVGFHSHGKKMHVIRDVSIDIKKVKHLQLLVNLDLVNLYLLKHLLAC